MANANAAQMTAVGTQVAAICDMIEQHRGTGTAISARRAAAISAMIDDVAATAAEGAPRAHRRKWRMASARGYKQEGRRLVGQGGERGVVVRARHRRTGQAVAVKSLHRRSGGSYVGDVLREACFAAAGGGHPSLVAFRTVARRPGTADYCIVTDDYVGLGQGLRDAVAQAGDGGPGGRPFPEAYVRRVMRHLLAGAEVMHRHGVVHRDIKPENIQVAGDGDGAMICNYGFAKSMAEKHPPPCQFPGTLAYMAPEVLARNAGHDTRADMWSLGCVMAELLTGEPPFKGTDEAHQLFKIFDVIGVPRQKEWEALKPQAHGAKVPAWRARQVRMRTIHRNRLRELIPPEVLSTDGFLVLKGLFACDPKKRLTAAAALHCPWFTDNIDDEAVATPERINISALASKSCSLAMSFFGRALGFIRPKVLLH